MTKPLSEMTLEELWELFPIFLTPHKEEWRAWYDEEKSRLAGFIPAEYGAIINHIGSTTLEGIWAKPIIDMLLEIPSDKDMASLKELLSRNGYICMSADDKRYSLNRGYTPEGFAERVYHLHLRFYGDNDELYFLDYLKAHPQEAEEYEKLKLKLWREYEHDRDGYTEAKSALVGELTQRGKEMFPQRYAR
ncbi:MAG: GrpB family protein [Eubacteriaceae bacterium]|jgi:GrpB-like predicted nucleotidyltransferase (UPF0157 family)|nr:GrpB family protein [Eubacteriaceae bacterium]